MLNVTPNRKRLHAFFLQNNRYKFTGHKRDKQKDFGNNFFFIQALLKFKNLLKL